MNRRVNKRHRQISLIEKKRAKLTLVAVFALLALFVSQPASAIQNSINYQGRLRDSGGTPIIVSTTMQFSIYSHATNGASGDTPSATGPLLWSETYDQSSGSCAKITPDAQGYFTLTLGNCVAFPSYLDFASGTYYLGVKIGADTESAPRVLFNSHPFALNSHRVDGFHATSTATAGQLLALGNDLSFNIGAGNLGGGNITLSSSTATSSFGGNLSVTGNATMATATIANLVISGSTNLNNFTFNNATGTSLSLANLSVTGTSSLGIINAGTWNGSVIGVAYGGTGTSTAPSYGQILMGNGSGGYNLVSTSSLGFASTTHTHATLSNGTGILAFTYNGSSAASVSLATTSVTASTYGTASSVPQFTVDAYGRITSASNVAIQITTSSVTGLGTMAVQNANNVTISGGTINATSIGATSPSTAIFTNASSTNIFATTGTFTNLVVTNPSSFANLTFTNATGTSIYLTNNLTALGNAYFGAIASGTWNGSVIGVAYGGTGTSTLGSAGTVVYSNGTSYAFSSVGNAGQLMQSNGSGAPSWVNTSSIITPPAGSNTNLQYNNNGAFGATNTLIWDNSRGDLVIGKNTSGGFFQLEAFNTSSPAVSVQWNDTVTGAGGYYLYEGSNQIGQIIGIGSNWGSTSRRGNVEYGVRTNGSSMTFWTNNGSFAERMRLASNGNLGIGTSSPQYKLDVYGDVNTTGTYRISGVDYGKFFIDATGTPGYLWMSSSTNGGRGYWVATSSLGIAVTSYTAGAGLYLNGSQFNIYASTTDFSTTSNYLDLKVTGVTANTYGSATQVPQISIDAKGRITSASNVAIQITTSSVTGLGTMAVQNANNVTISGGTINATSIGATSPSTAVFTDASTTGNMYVGNNFRVNNQLTAGYYNAISTTAFSYLGGGLIIGNSSTMQGITGYERVVLSDETGAMSDWSFKVAGGGWSVYNLGSSDGTLAAPTISANDSNLGQFAFWGHDGNAWQNAANIYSKIDGTPSAGSMPGRIVFETTPSGTTVPVIRMVIDSQGRVGIGTTSPQYALDVRNGDINTTGTYRISGVDYGSFFINSTGTAGYLWMASSTNGGRGYWVPTSSLGISGGSYTAGAGLYLNGNQFNIFASSTDFATTSNYLDLKTTGVVAGTYGTATRTAQFTVDAKGRISFVTSTAITGVSPSSSALTSGYIWVGNSGNLASPVAMSGDAALSNAGALTINNNAITSAKLLDGTIQPFDISTSSAPTGLAILAYSSPTQFTWLASTTFSLSSHAHANMVTGTGANSQVAFFNGANSIAGNANYIWDNTNGRLAIGTTSPQYKLDVMGDINTTGTYRISGVDYGKFFINSTGTAGYLWMASSTNGGRGAWVATSSLGITASAAGSNGNIQFNNGGALGATSALFWDNTNYRLGIGTTSPSAVLQVKGSGITDIFRLSTNSLAPAMVVNSSGQIGIGTSSPSSLVHLFGNDSAGVGLRIQNAEAGGKAWSIISGGSNTDEEIGSLIFYDNTSSTRRMMITSDGRVQVGNISTPNILSVNGAISIASTSPATSSYALYNLGGQLWWNGTNFTAGLSKWTNGTSSDIYRINGNIGIGTTTPLSKLHIAEGGLRISSGTASWVIGPDAFPNRDVNTDALGLNMTNSSTWKAGLFSEVGFRLLSYGINASQMGNRNTSTIGSIFRLDTRDGTPYWSIKRQPPGNSTVEYSDMQIAQTGEIGFGGFANDSNSFLGQVHVLSAASTTVGFVVQGAANQTADIQQWRNNSGGILSVVDDVGRFAIGTSTADALLSLFTPSTTVMTIASTTGVNLLEAKNLSRNFGLTMDAGAFIDRNAYFAEEFFRERADVTAAGRQNWGDNTAFGTALGGTMTFSIVDDMANGISRMQTGAINSGGDMYLAGISVGTDPHLPFAVNNLPVILAKVRPSNIGTNDRVWVGLSNAALATNAEPTNGVYFTNSGANWVGITRSGSVSATATCGVAVQTGATQFALLKIEVRATNDVHFFVDNDASDGISFTECSSTATNIPTGTALTAMIRLYSTSNGRQLDTDFFRVWQDDSAIPPASTVLVMDEPTTTPELTVDERVALLESAQIANTSNFSDVNNLLAEYGTKIDQASTADESIGNSVNTLNLSLDETRSMLAVLDSRISTLENTASLVTTSLLNLNTAVTDINSQLTLLSASSTGGLEISNFASADIAANTLIVNGSSVFNGAVSMKKHIAFSGDTVGQAKILAGHTSSTVVFAEPYESLPIVNVTPLDYDGRWKVTAVAEEGFRIEVSEILAVDTIFNWYAFGANADAKVFVSDGTTSTIGMVIEYIPEVIVPETPTETQPIDDPGETVVEPAPTTTPSNDTTTPPENGGATEPAVTTADDAATDLLPSSPDEATSDSGSASGDSLVAPVADAGTEQPPAEAPSVPADTGAGDSPQI